MSRVPPSRVPSRPPAPVQRPKRTKHELQVKPVKGSMEDSTLPETHLDKPGDDTGAHGADAITHALTHAEQAEAKEAREANAETREQAEHAEQEKKSGFYSRMFSPKAGAGKQQQHGQQQSGQKKDGFQKQSVPATGTRPILSPQGTNPVTGTHQVMAAASVAAVKATQLSGAFQKLDRPPDAFTLLKEAKEKGVLFQEDWEHEGNTEDQDDPELAAAIEDVIAKLFGKAGILRVGPGKNEQRETVIVVVATHGFSEQSLAAIPERSGKFPTLLALSFELLPLKRERV